MNRSQQFKYDVRLLYFVGLLISFVFSYFALKDVVINPDGLCYVLSAERIKEVGLKEGMQFCTQANWPFYSFLLIIFSSFLPFGLESTAYFLNALFDAGSLITFVMIMRLLTNNPRIILLGFITFVCAHDFNSVRDNIIRDHGFWLFYLLSVYFLLRYATENRLLQAFNWAGSLLIASLFRVEGFIFLMMLPFSVFFLNNRLKRFIILSSPLLIAFVICGLLYLFYADLFERINVSLNKIQHSLELISTQFSHLKNNIATHVLTADSMRDLSIVTMSLLIVWYIITCASQLSWLYTGLVFVAIKSKTVIKREYVIVLISYLIVNLIITTSFFGIHLFLSKRYLMAQSFILMLFVPFALNYLLTTHFRYKKFLLTLVFTWLALSTVHVIFLKKTPHVYLRESGNWIAAYIPNENTLFSNNEFVLYYANRNKENLFTNMTKEFEENQYDYVAIDTKKLNAIKLIDLMNRQNAILVREFANKKGQELLLYKLSRSKENKVL